ncbi:MAG: glucose-1-phosphate cytidylyltransferase [Phycisphaeraceae bacterium]|nr:glucose-1-phosphate cytidylyltransferase [Phycisphaeraceae bacterium]
MKVVILAGGMGTRLAEETEVRPKPMVEIGGQPILWHIMKHYAHFGLREFVIALGYKGHMIRQFFLNYHGLFSDLTVHLRDGTVELRQRHQEDWIVHLVDTGLASNTGGRLLRLAPLLDNETFMLTYGDGVSSVDIHALLALHQQSKRVATITAVRPPARFGELVMDHNRVVQFAEKPQIGEGWINGGFMVFEPAIFEHLHGDSESLEGHAMQALATRNLMTAYRHEGFWQCMDTKRDLTTLETLWKSGNPPWKLWRDQP